MVWHCLLMRINAMFDVFLRGSLPMPCSRMVKSLQLQHPEDSSVVASCHAAQAILSSCTDRWQSSVCRHWSSLRGSRRHSAVRQHGGQTAAARYLTEKSHRPTRKNLQARHDHLGTSVIREGLFNLNFIISASSSLWTQPSGVLLN